jgi:hypothetical protein
MYSEKTNQKRLASDHNKNDRSIDRHLWPKYGIPLPLWLYISSASSDRKSHTVMLYHNSKKIKMAAGASALNLLSSYLEFY